MPKNKHEKPLDIATFLRIRKWYLLALAGIALMIIIAQLLIQTHLNTQLNDSRVINVAGRQRALSQKLVKEILLLEEATTSEDSEKLRSEIQQTVSVWKASHEGLQKGYLEMNLPLEKDAEIRSLFQHISAHHEAMVTSTEAILSQEKITSDFNKQKSNLLETKETFYV